MNLSQFTTTRPRARNYGFLKQYTDSYFKLTHMYSVLRPGYEERNKAPPKPRSKGHDAEKLQNSLSRTRSKVHELALCNSWDFFVTLTVSGEKHDRYDLRGTYSRMAKWFNNYNNRTDAALQYLLVPEPHKDGAWHFHGLILGLPISHLTEFTLSDPIPWRLKEMLLAGRQLYNWPAYARTFGYVTLDQIQSPERCSNYMVKYITKDLQQSSIELNHHLYYCSHGLQRAATIYSGPIKREIEYPDFENEYVRTKRFDTLEAALPYFCDDN